MAFTYNPTDWHTGDVITEGKLNNIEDGIKGLYPTPPEVIAPEQTITITSSTPVTGVPVTLASDETVIDIDVLLGGGYVFSVTFPDGTVKMGSGWAPDYGEDVWTGKVICDLAQYDESTDTGIWTQLIFNNNILQFISTNYEQTSIYPGTFTISLMKNGEPQNVFYSHFLPRPQDYMTSFPTEARAMVQLQEGSDEPENVMLISANPELILYSHMNVVICTPFDIFPVTPLSAVIINPYTPVEVEGEGDSYYYIDEPTIGWRCVYPNGDTFYVVFAGASYALYTPDSEPVDPDIN